MTKDEIEKLKKENQALRMLLNEIPPFITETKIAFMVIDLNVFPKELVDIIMSLHNKEPSPVNVDRYNRYTKTLRGIHDN